MRPVDGMKRVDVITGQYKMGKKKVVPLVKPYEGLHVVNMWREMFYRT